MEGPSDSTTVANVATHVTEPLRDPTRPSSHMAELERSSPAPAALGAQTSGKTPLSTADLVKIFEITLAEIRSAQTLAFSVLGFSIACITIIQKMTNSSNSTAYYVWGSGVVLCLCGALYIASTKAHHRPLEKFIRAAHSDEPEFVLEDLRDALGNASDALNKSHRSKKPILAGVILVAASLIVEMIDQAMK